MIGPDSDRDSEPTAMTNETTDEVAEQIDNRHTERSTCSKCGRDADGDKVLPFSEYREAIARSQDDLIGSIGELEEIMPSEYDGDPPMAPNPTLCKDCRRELVIWIRRGEGGLTQEDKDRLRERLAALEHTQWWQWSKNVAEVEDISEETLERWEGYWVPYEDLSEEVKEHDREWSDRVLEILYDHGVLAIDQGGETA